CDQWFANCLMCGLRARRSEANIFTETRSYLALLGGYTHEFVRAPAVWSLSSYGDAAGQASWTLYCTRIQQRKNFARSAVMPGGALDLPVDWSETTIGDGLAAVCMRICRLRDGWHPPSVHDPALAAAFPLVLSRLHDDADDA